MAEMPGTRAISSFTLDLTKLFSSRELMLVERKAKKPRMSEERFLILMPWSVTSLGSLYSTRLSAFWTFTMLMSESVPLLNVRDRE